jgi:hypothetical protein
VAGIGQLAAEVQPADEAEGGAQRQAPGRELLRRGGQTAFFQQDRAAAAATERRGKEEHVGRHWFCGARQVRLPRF